MKIGNSSILWPASKLKLLIRQCFMEKGNFQLVDLSNDTNKPQSEHLLCPPLHIYGLSRGRRRKLRLYYFNILHKINILCSGIIIINNNKIIKFFIRE